MPKKSPHPHVAWRDGRPRFTPGPVLRGQGHKAYDLRHADGRWFSRGEAVDWSEAFQKNLAASRDAQAQEAAEKARRAPKPYGHAEAARRPPVGRPVVMVSIAQLCEDWQRSAKFRQPADEVEARRLRQAKAIYSPKTIKDFRQKLGVIEKHDASLWASPADALSQPVLFGLYEELVEARGLATARGAIAALSIALSWGKRRGKITFRENSGVNPAKALAMDTPPPRVRFATRAEIEALVAVADHQGRPEIGDMVMLGLWTGQRQGDRLALEDRGLLNKRRVFRQSKTGAIVAVMQAPELERRLSRATARRRAAKAEAMLAAKTAEERAAVEKRFARVVLNELVDERYQKCFWRPYEGQTYTHAFAEIRALAVKGIRDEKGTGWIVRPCQSLADFQERDLRDTSVTWLALAGATIPEICAITGHSMDSATRILKHYLAMHPELADAAMAKMITWFDAGGETEIGF